MEENRTENDKIEIEISVKELFAIFIKNLWIIVICAILCGTAVYIYNDRYIEPIYRSEVIFFIDPAGTNIDSELSDSARLQLDAQSLSYAKQIQNTYLEILRRPSFVAKLSNEYSLIYGKEMEGEVTAFGIIDTQLFKIQVTSSSKRAAYDIARQIETTAPEAIIEMAPNAALSIADKATEPGTPINNNTIRNTAIGAFLGALLIYGISFLVFIFDRRVKSEEDLKNRYDIPILGGIIDFNRMNKR